MGMEHHTGPKRRRVGVEDPSQRIQVSMRLSGPANRMVEEMQKEGVLSEDGCAKGDVIEVAIREVARRTGVDLEVDRICKTI